MQTTCKRQTDLTYFLEYNCQRMQRVVILYRLIYRKLVEQDCLRSGRLRSRKYTGDHGAASSALALYRTKLSFDNLEVVGA